jgi:hypothetical protein
LNKNPNIPVRKLLFILVAVFLFNLPEAVVQKAKNVAISGKSIKFRRTNSLNVSTESIFIVDGVITNDIDGIAPEAVRKIEVLRGPVVCLRNQRIEWCDNNYPYDREGLTR